MGKANVGGKPGQSGKVEYYVTTITTGDFSTDGTKTLSGLPVDAKNAVIFAEGDRTIDNYASGIIVFLADAEQYAFAYRSPKENYMHVSADKKSGIQSLSNGNLTYVQGGGGLANSRTYRVIVW